MDDLEIDRVAMFTNALIGRLCSKRFRALLQRKRAVLPPGCILSDTHGVWQVDVLTYIRIRDVDAFTVWLKDQRPFLLDDFLEAQAAHAVAMLQGPFSGAGTVTVTSKYPGNVSAFEIK